MAITDTESKYSTTIHTYLGTADTGDAYKRVVPIKDFPDLGGSPDQVEITDLDDDVQKFLLGVQSMSLLTFTANYSKEGYTELQEMADGTIRKFCVAFGSTGDQGIFTWEGQLSVWVAGAGTNAAREMKIAISATTKITMNSTATFSVA